MKTRLFDEFRTVWSEKINQQLESAFPREMDMPDELRESMLYSLNAGGKRIRPLMLLATVAALDGPVAASVPAACAVEMVHTYSLIHDDLPAMDNDDYRRGKLTNHKVYGEAMAILAGDALLTHAFYTLTKLGDHPDFCTERILTIVREMSWYAGPRGMVGGQVADIRSEQGQTDRARLDYIHRHKTGDMIVFSLRAGGHLAGADEKQLASLERFGSAIGLAFQIQDDILDVSGNESVLGKPAGSDEEGEKVTFPYLLGLEECHKLVAAYTEEGKQALQDANLSSPQLLYELADYLMRRDR